MKTIRLVSILILFTATLVLNFSDVFGKMITRDSVTKNIEPSAYRYFTASPDGTEQTVEQYRGANCIVISVSDPFFIVNCTIINN